MQRISLMSVSDEMVARPHQGDRIVDLYARSQNQRAGNWRHRDSRRDGAWTLVGCTGLRVEGAVAAVLQIWDAHPSGVQIWIRRDGVASSEVDGWAARFTE